MKKKQRSLFLMLTAFTSLAIPTASLNAGTPITSNTSAITISQTPQNTFTIPGTFSIDVSYDQVAAKYTGSQSGTMAISDYNSAGTAPSRKVTALFTPNAGVTFNTGDLLSLLTASPNPITGVTTFTAVTVYTTTSPTTQPTIMTYSAPLPSLTATLTVNFSSTTAVGTARTGNLVLTSTDNI